MLKLSNPDGEKVSGRRRPRAGPSRRDTIRRRQGPHASARTIVGISGWRGAQNRQIFMTESEGLRGTCTVLVFPYLLERAVVARTRISLPKTFEPFLDLSPAGSLRASIFETTSISEARSRSYQRRL